MIDRAVQKRFNGIYGESIGAKDVAFWGPGARSYYSARWIRRAEIVSGYDDNNQFFSDEHALVSVPFVFVRARLPLVKNLEYPGINEHRKTFLDVAQFRHAIAVAGLNSVLSQRMEKLYEIETSLSASLQKQVEEMCKHDCTPEKLPYPQGDDWRKPLVPLLQDWFKALKFADAGHRAAGLLAADSLLKAFESVMPRDHFGSSQSSTAEQSKLCSQLKALGADISLDITGSYYYSGSWLTKAKDLNLDSEGGRLASLFWMSTAGDGNLAEPGSELFREVIKKGKALLTKKIDAVTEAQVHFMIGDAYSDIVALAAGEIGGNGDYDASKYEAEAEEDQTKALAHYRAGLAIDNASPSAKDAWSQAWHLSSGLLPRQRYVCFGD